MFVQTILDSKGSDVIAVTPTMTLGDAARILTAHRIGAVVVRDEGGGLAGILSERDIVRRVATEGGSCLSDSVGAVMTRHVVTCTRRHTIGEVMDLMTDGKFRHVPVLDNDELVGLISIGDVVKHRIREVETETVQLRQYIWSA